MRGLASALNHTRHITSSLVAHSDRSHPGQLMWPLEPRLLQSFHPQGKAIAFPVNALHKGTAVITEHKQTGTEWVELHLRLDDRDQAIDRLSHVNRLPV